MNFLATFTNFTDLLCLKQYFIFILLIITLDEITKNNAKLYIFLEVNIIQIKQKLANFASQRDTNEVRNDNNCKRKKIRGI